MRSPINKIFTVKNLLVLGIIALFVIAFSCEGSNSTVEVDCAQCYVNEPDSFELVTELSVGDLYDSAYVQYYKGNVESGKLSWQGEVYTSTFYHRVPVNEFYSVRATYMKDGKTTIAIDGDRMVSRYVVGSCDTDCWIIKGGYLNVKLKY
jgi:hypothetical protein